MNKKNISNPATTASGNCPAGEAIKEEDSNLEFYSPSMLKPKHRKMFMNGLISFNQACDLSFGWNPEQSRDAIYEKWEQTSLFPEH